MRNLETSLKNRKEEMANNKMLYYKSTRPPKWPFNVVVKKHGSRTILYITYGGGRKSGGGAWSENLNNVHPRTMSMIEDYLGEKTVKEIMNLLKPKRKSNPKPKA
ncbi:MAG: hypothetical protein CMQ41_07780 [Gammaproteobacteria bacterium]|nr:hypothetical protein [Gammaproteobacteria bacterium]